MTAYSCTLIFMLIVIAFTSAAAFGAFDVSVHFNGGSDVVYIGEDNILEVYITNGFPIEGMSLGLHFSNSAGPFEFVTPYGSRPNPPRDQYIMEHGDAIDNFGFGGNLLANFSLAPNDILFGGVNSGPAPGTPLPTHVTSTLCYSMKIRIPSGVSPTAGGFCIDNVFYPPAGNWLFVYYANPGNSEDAIPTFQGQTNTSQTEPDAPAVCFDLVQRPPCDPPQITNCSGTSILATFFGPAVYDLDATTPDAGAITWTVEAIDPVVNAPTINLSGLFTFGFDLTEGGTVKNFRAIATNECGSADTCYLA
ncbi:MAG: hypothetical protein WBP42_04920, partial [Candidatus Zixiibacteriota bacterium]